MKRAGWGSSSALRVANRDLNSWSPATLHALLNKGIEFGRLDHPLHALSRLICATRNLGEGLVETQIVANAVLPSAGVEAVEGIICHDPFVNVVERHLLFVGGENSHANKLGVRMGWLQILCGVGRIVDAFGRLHCNAARVVGRWRRLGHGGGSRAERSAGRTND